MKFCIYLQTGLITSGTVNKNVNFSCAEGMSVLDNERRMVANVHIKQHNVNICSHYTVIM